VILLKILRGCVLITSVKTSRNIVSKSLLEIVAKVILFAKQATSLKVLNAEFDRGVYRVDLSGVCLPVKPFVEDIVGEHILCKDLVEKILETDSRTRDDDMLLILSVWDAQGVHIELNDVELEMMFNAESVTRARRKVQNDEGKFLPTSLAVAKRRGLNEELLREHYGRGEFY
jgi:hypothetical protein